MKLSFPPVITLACLGMQFVYIMMLPLEVNLSLLLGLILLIGSIALIVMAFKELKNYETTYIPDGEPEKLVNTGPFKISKEPNLPWNVWYLNCFSFSDAIYFSFINTYFFLIYNSKHMDTLMKKKNLKKSFQRNGKNIMTSTKRWLW